MTASSRTRSSSDASAGSRSREPVLHLLGDQPAPGVEDLVDEVVAADRADRGEQTRREPVVVRRERDLGVGRDVVQVARPADAVADGPAVDEPRRLERAELLEDARSGSRRGAWQAVRARLAPLRRSSTRMSRRSDEVPAGTAPVAPTDPAKAPCDGRAVAALTDAWGSGPAIPEG